MEGKDTGEDFEDQSREDDRNVLEEGSPVPDPDDQEFGSDELPEAD